ncbi:MAG: S8 family serine peptidase [Desulfofustis sp.]|nr:S8 family serine peptidase [Desulfofustis sp.]
MTLIATGAVIPFGAEPEKGQTTPVVAIRAFDDNGFTSNYTLLRGIDYALARGVKVLSMSWGTEQNSPFMESAMSYASEQGMIVVAAAGNAPSGKAVYPAAYDTVIGVGALMPDGSRWSQSNYGSFVSVYGPGLADLPVGSGGVPGIYAGTSIATAYTARRVAAILDKNPEADLRGVLRRLLQGN